MKQKGADFFIGLDLGQKRDFSTLAVVERISGPSTCYHLRHLERLDVNTSYLVVAQRARNLVEKTARHGNLLLVMDMTGLGAPVLDLLRTLGVRPVAITITAGRSISGTCEQFHVPKRALIATLVALFELCRLKIGLGIPNATELIDELLNFQLKIHRRTRQESYAAKGTNRHDDLVLALALAVFYAENLTQRTRDKAGIRGREDGADGQTNSKRKSVGAARSRSTE